MDFDDSPEEAAFRLECRAFLDANAEPKADGGSLADSYWAQPPSPAKELAQVAACKSWQRTKFDAGWAGLTWPKEFGGRGLSSLLAGVYAEEESRYNVATGVFAQSIGMAGPTLIAVGSDQQRSTLLEPMLTGEHTWCQLFSEPNAGSDLAGLRTAAVRDGDEFVVNGQKVWTSNAVTADYGMLLVRTDVDQPKHRGITYLVVDMTSPGIEIRPLVQITGAAHFNEVFLTDVRVPVENVVGDINAGWGPVLVTLANERQGIGTSSASMSSSDALYAMAAKTGCLDDPLVRQDLMRLHTYAETIRFLGYRVRTAAARGETPGPESSVMKLAATRRITLLGNVVMRIMGPAGALAGADAFDGGYWQNMAFLGQWMSKIGGGTDEVQRNIIGDNVLGLPSEPRVDKGIPFRDIPT